MFNEHHTVLPHASRVNISPSRRRSPPESSCWATRCPLTNPLQSPRLGMIDLISSADGNGIVRGGGVEQLALKRQRLQPRVFAKCVDLLEDLTELIRSAGRQPFPVSVVNHGRCLQQPHLRIYVPGADTRRS
jgi:hypothetical protein